MLVGEMQDTFGRLDAAVWQELAAWCNAALPVVYLHRVVDTHHPTMHLVYYGSCLVDKQLRVLQALEEAQDEDANKFIGR